MAYTKIGRIRPAYKGTWSQDAAYAALEMAQSGDGKLTYIAIKDVPAGTPLTNSAYWAVVLDVSEVLEAAENAANAVNNITDVKANALTAAFDANPAVIYPDENSILKPVSVLSPVQAGSGDPSPSNIRPITGRTGAVLTRSGKNLFDASTIKVGYFVRYDTGLENPASSQIYAASDYIPVKNMIAFTHYFASDDVGGGVAFYDKRKQFVKGMRIGNSPFDELNTVATNTITLESDIAYMRFSLMVEHAGKFQLELGSTATAYEPYHGDTYTLDFGQTVYGGRVDWNAGLVTVDRVMVTLDGTEAWYANATNTTGYTRWAMFMNDAITNPLASAKMGDVSSHYKEITPDESYQRAQGISHRFTTLYIYDTAYAEKTLEEWTAYLAAQYAAGTPVQVAYKLATPTTIQLTPQLISALSGLNTVYGDGDALEGSYNKSLSAAFEEIKNAILSMGGNV